MQNLYFKRWNSHIHSEFPLNVDSTNRSRDNLSRKIGHITPRIGAESAQWPGITDRHRVGSLLAPSPGGAGGEGCGCLGWLEHEEGRGPASRAARQVGGQALGRPGRGRRAGTRPARQRPPDIRPARQAAGAHCQAGSQAPGQERLARPGPRTGQPCMRPGQVGRQARRPCAFADPRTPRCTLRCPCIPLVLPGIFADRDPWSQKRAKNSTVSVPLLLAPGYSRCLHARLPYTGQARQPSQPSQPTQPTQPAQPAQLSQPSQPSSPSRRLPRRWPLAPAWPISSPGWSRPRRLRCPAANSRSSYERLAEYRLTSTA